MGRKKWHTTIAVLFCIASFTVSLHAQGRGAAGPCGGAARGGDPVQAPRMLKPGLFLITGGGANSLIRVTTEGLILVDTKNPGEEQYSGLAQQTKAISDLPVKVVINTQHHPDHVGNNQKFLDAGAQIVALEALKSFMTSDPRTSTCTGRPTQTFAKDNVVKLGGAEVHLHFYGRGHTGDDTMVYFPDAKVVMVSDDITDTSPVIDWANGGSWVEWSKALEGVLKLDFDMAIPGRGEPKTRADVQAFKDKVDLVIKRANDAIKAGATKETLAMQVKVDDLAPWNLNAQFFGNLYDELKR
jgi:glyoxylase-like metal-dependent hydrolase (beta-lactamase superfamily II)